MQHGSVPHICSVRKSPISKENDSFHFKTQFWWMNTFRLGMREGWFTPDWPITMRLSNQKSSPSGRLPPLGRGQDLQLKDTQWTARDWTFLHVPTFHVEAYLDSKMYVWWENLVSSCHLVFIFQWKQLENHRSLEIHTSWNWKFCQAMFSRKQRTHHSDWLTSNTKSGEPRTIPWIKFNPSCLSGW